MNIMSSHHDSGLLSGLRVLVVEDQSVIADWVANYLRDFGCEVVGPAASVDEALALLDTARVDAALLDVNLQGHFADPIARNLESQGIPFLLISAYGPGILPPELSNAVLLEKPLDAQELLKAMRELLWS